MADLLDITCAQCEINGGGTYEMPGRCSNCGAEYRVKISKGHDAPGNWLGARCPNCGCSRVGCYSPPTQDSNGN